MDGAFVPIPATRSTMTATDGREDRCRGGAIERPMMRPNRQSLFDPILSAGQLDRIIQQQTDLNSRLAPIESSYAGTQGLIAGALAELRVSIDTTNALQQQLIDVAAFVTDGALSLLPTDTGMYANYPPFSARSLGIEDRLSAIGA